MTEKEKDIVSDILQRAMDVVRAEMGPRGLDRATADVLIAHISALEKPVRQHWHDKVAQRDLAQLQTAKAAALAEVRRTGKVEVAATRHGIHRATLYRMLKTRNSHSG